MATTIQIYGTLPGGGGNIQDEKDVSITQNGTVTILPDTDYDAIKKVIASVNVSGGGGTSDFPKFTQEVDEQERSVYLVTEGITTEDVDALNENLFDVYDNVVEEIIELANSNYNNIDSVISALSATTFSALIQELSYIVLRHEENNMMFTFMVDDTLHLTFKVFSESSVDIYNFNDYETPFLCYITIDDEEETPTITLDDKYKYLVEYDLDYYIFDEDTEDPNNYTKMYLLKDEIGDDNEYKTQIQNVIYSAYDDYYVRLIEELDLIADKSSSDIQVYVQNELTSETMLALASLFSVLYDAYDEYGVDELDFQFSTGRKLSIKPTSSSVVEIYNYNNNADLYSYTLTVPPASTPQNQEEEVEE